MNTNENEEHNQNVIRGRINYLLGHTEFNEIKMPYVPMSDYEVVFKEFDQQNEADTIDTNGWQNDFWWYIKLNDKDYVLAGSWFYGHYNLSIKQ